MLFQSVQVSGIKRLHSVVQPSPLSSSRTFYHPRQKPDAHKWSRPAPEARQPLASPNLLSVSVDLPFTRMDPAGHAPRVWLLTQPCAGEVRQWCWRVGFVPFRGRAVVPRAGSCRCVHGSVGRRLWGLFLSSGSCEQSHWEHLCRIAHFVKHPRVPCVPVVGSDVTRDPPLPLSPGQ